MSAHRRGYLAALVIAVVTLIGTVGAAAVYATSHGSRWAAASPADNGDTGWGEMMGGSGRGGGTMGGSDSGTATVSLRQAQTIAHDWVSKNAAGATLDSGVTMPMGYVFTVSQVNQMVARIMVNDDTGEVIVRSVTYSRPTATARSVN